METPFDNPFQLTDLLVFDDANFCRILSGCLQKMGAGPFARAMHAAPVQLIERVLPCFSNEQHQAFALEKQCELTPTEIDLARQWLLDLLFWELTYWKTPELYEELTVGEHLHPGIFRQLEPLVRGKIVLDAGAGSGRASFECIRHGARLVYAVEPSPGLLHLLKQKLVSSAADSVIRPGSGDFAHLPLEGQSVDLALSCSAFTSQAEQGGEPGLVELKRVVRPGGSIVLIWPRPEDHSWLAEHGFQYERLPGGQEMSVQFSSFPMALRCARHFYAHNQRVLHYLLHARHPEVPFSVLGFNAPCDYYWLQVR